MTGFKKGQKVRRIKGGEHVGMKVGDVGTVASVLRDGGNLIIEEFQKPGWSHSAENFELVPDGPQWSDVEAFDRVTFRIRHLDPVGDETRMAYDVDGTPNVLGVSTRSLLIERIWELLSIEKPKPQPPTTPGSHVTVPFPGWESGINHLFLLDSGKWASQTGLAFWPAEDVASKDFTVVHDAGATS